MQNAWRFPPRLLRMGALAQNSAHSRVDRRLAVLVRDLMSEAGTPAGVPAFTPISGPAAFAPAGGS